MYKLTASYDGNPAPHWTGSYDNALDAVHAFDKCVDWGFADEYATYNLYEPNGRCHTKVFHRSGVVQAK